MKGREEEEGEKGRERRGGIKEGLTYRQFIQSSYPSIKSSQPDLKFMIREAQGVNARAFVRFGTSLLFGLIVSVSGLGVSFLELDSRLFRFRNGYELYIISTPTILAPLVLADM